MLQPDFKTFEFQQQLAEYCRTGTYEANIPGVRTENLSQYRNLVYGVVKDTLENAYPLTQKLLGSTQWNQVTHHFFSNHKCQSPQVWYMPKEFYTFLIETEHPLLQKYPPLKNLLWFEWVEIALFMMEDKPCAAKGFADLAKSKLVLNPEHEIFVLAYPVHKMDAKIIKPKDKSTYYVCGHRDAEGQVIFTELTPALVRILEYLSGQPLSFNTLLKKLTTEFQLKINPADKQVLFSFLQDAQKTQLILNATMPCKP